MLEVRGRLFERIFSTNDTNQEENYGDDEKYVNKSSKNMEPEEPEQPKS